MRLLASIFQNKFYICSIFVYALCVVQPVLSLNKTSHNLFYVLNSFIFFYVFFNFMFSFSLGPVVCVSVSFWVVLLFFMSGSQGVL